MSTKVCNRDCFNCKFKDCIVDDMVSSEFNLSKILDKEVVLESTPKEVLDRRKASLRWYYKNRDQALETGSKYREEHREELRETARVYYEDNKEELRARHLANYYSNHEDNKKKSRDAKRARYQANPDYYRQKQREYRQRRKEIQNASSKEQQAVLV